MPRQMGNSVARHDAHSRLDVGNDELRVLDSYRNTTGSSKEARRLDPYCENIRENVTEHVVYIFSKKTAVCGSALDMAWETVHMG